jgi:hypothetical protein
MKIGDKVVFKYYDTIPDWKLGTFEILSIYDKNYIFIKYTEKSRWVLHKTEEFISEKEYRRLKLNKINERKYY